MNISISSINPFLWRALLAALVWGFWTLLMPRYGKGVWGMPILCIATAAYVIATTLWQTRSFTVTQLCIGGAVILGIVWAIGSYMLKSQMMIPSEPWEWGSMFFLPVFCGILNGIGIQQYGAIFTAPNPAQWTTMTTALLPMIIFVGGIILFKENASAKQWFGLAGVVFGLYLLGEKR